MGAKVKLFVLACIDPRFRHATEKFIEEKFSVTPEQYDFKTDAGGCKEIAAGSEAGKWIVENMKIGVTKHGASTIVLINHLDCAHYGGSGAFPGMAAELGRHVRDLSAAAGIIAAKLPKVKFKAFMVAKEGDKFAFEEVKVQA